MAISSKTSNTSIDGTPCEVVIEQARVVHYPDRIIELFPDDPDLAASVSLARLS
jgi:hypothetical protein